MDNEVLDCLLEGNIWGWTPERMEELEVIVAEKRELAKTGMIVSFSQEEAYFAGAFEEKAISFEDAVASRFDFSIPSSVEDTGLSTKEVTQVKVGLKEE